jgi:hypothetical protein
VTAVNTPDIAQFYYEQRERIAEDAPMLRSLIAAINAEYDLTRAQWAPGTIGFAAFPSRTRCRFTAGR